MTAYLAAHWVAILTAAIAIASEIMPFLPTRANGIVQAGINIGKWALSKKAPPLKSVALLPLLFVAVLASGCATVSTPANATVGQKFEADAVAVAAIANDVKTKCGPEFAGLGPVILSALQIAASPQDVLSDIMAVVQAAPTLYKDGQAVACAISTVVNDLKALKPKPGTTAFLMLDMAQQVQAMADSAPADMCVASR